jgi:uncharacterized membrane protein YkoI
MVSENAREGKRDYLGPSTSPHKWSSIMRKYHRVIAIVAALGIGTGAIAAKAPAPKVSKARAEALALKLAPGRIISSEYEYEGGGWRYSFDIQQRGHVQEIGIDGQTGKVVENKSEGKVDHD